MVATHSLITRTLALIFFDALKLSLIRSDHTFPVFSLRIKQGGVSLLIESLIFTLHPTRLETRYAVHQRTTADSEKLLAKM